MINENDNTKNEAVIKRLTIFKQENKPIHVIFNNLGRNTFFNGRIISIQEDRFIINDRKYGESLVFLDDVLKLESYRGTFNA